MRGSSVKSLEAVLGQLRSASPSATVADELFGVVAVIDSAPALRRLLTDPSTDASAKADLVGQLFAAKVSDATLQILRSAVSGRWAAGRDFTDGLEILGVAAHVEAARAAGDLDTLEAGLFAVGNVIREHSDLRRIITDKSADPVGKDALLDDLFASKVDSVALALVKQAARARTGSFDKVLDVFAEQVASGRGRKVAKVRAAYELDSQEVERLRTALAAKYGSDIQLNITTDPTVVGGIAVSVGDEVVDATMSTRLEAARRQLAG